MCQMLFFADCIHLFLIVWCVYFVLNDVYYANFKGNGHDFSEKNIKNFVLYYKFKVT